ncbi:hypothetical protein [Brucella pituitosa]
MTGLFHGLGQGNTAIGRFQPVDEGVDRPDLRLNKSPECLR